MPYKLVFKRGCRKGVAAKNPTRACTRVYNPLKKKYYSKAYMPFDKATRQLGYLRKFAQDKGYK